MWPDRISNPGPLTYESGALPTALRGVLMVIILGIPIFFFFFTFLVKLMVIKKSQRRKYLSGLNCSGSG